ncbi:hypothetical protein D3C74_495340 [compost metagenome]
MHPHDLTALGNAERHSRSGSLHYIICREAECSPDEFFAGSGQQHRISQLS